MEYVFLFSRSRIRERATQTDEIGPFLFSNVWLAAFAFLACHCLDLSFHFDTPLVDRNLHEQKRLLTSFNEK